MSCPIVGAVVLPYLTDASSFFPYPMYRPSLHNSSSAVHQENAIVSDRKTLNDQWPCVCLSNCEEENSENSIEIALTALNVIFRYFLNFSLNSKIRSHRRLYIHIRALIWKITEKIYNKENRKI